MCYPCWTWANNAFGVQGGGWNFHCCTCEYISGLAECVHIKGSWHCLSISKAVFWSFAKSGLNNHHKKNYIHCVVTHRCPNLSIYITHTLPCLSFCTKDSFISFVWVWLVNIDLYPYLNTTQRNTNIFISSSLYINHRHNTGLYYKDWVAHIGLWYWRVNCITRENPQCVIWRLIFYFSAFLLPVIFYDKKHSHRRVG